MQLFLAAALVTLEKDLSTVLVSLTGATNEVSITGTFPIIGTENVKAAVVVDVPTFVTVQEQVLSFLQAKKAFDTIMATIIIFFILIFFKVKLNFQFLAGVPKVFRKIND